MKFRLTQGDSDMNSTLDTMTSDIAEHLRMLQSLVTKALIQAMNAFEDIDVELASEAGAVADRVEHMHHVVEGLVFEVVSKHQPTDHDLRRLIAYRNTSESLHRIGRYASKIVDIVGHCEDLDHFKELESLPYLAELARSAIDMSMRAVLEGDLSEIDELEKLEAQSDREAAEMFEEIAGYLNRRRDISELAMYYIIVGRYCERAADQAISIAESASYMVTGKRVKLGLAYKGESASLLD
jgi:phosphate transport system protein